MRPGLVRRLQSDPKVSHYCPKIIYVLSSGAAKGFCHVGMLAALETRGVKPDLVVGTSAGSLIGALFCHFGNTADLLARIEEILHSEVFAAFEKKYFGERAPLDGHILRGMRHFFSSLADSVRMKMHLGMSIFTSAMIAESDVSVLYEKMFEGVSYKSLKFPFAAVAVDLSKGAPAVFTDIKGPEGVMRAVMASCAIPLVFPAVESRPRLRRRQRNGKSARTRGARPPAKPKPPTCGLRCAAAGAPVRGQALEPRAGPATPRPCDAEQAVCG